MPLTKTEARLRSALAAVDAHRVHAHTSSKSMRITGREAVAKESLNLSVERASVERARRYAELHATSISRLVDEFLASLPLDTERRRREDFPPVVRRLLGVAAGSDVGVDDYHEYLEQKYLR
jgi:uncharacterized protein DUF6364